MFNPCLELHKPPSGSISPLQLFKPWTTRFVQTWRCFGKSHRPWKMRYTHIVGACQHRKEKCVLWDMKGQRIVQTQFSYLILLDMLKKRVPTFLSAMPSFCGGRSRSKVNRDSMCPLRISEQRTGTPHRIFTTYDSLPTYCAYVFRTKAIPARRFPSIIRSQSKVRFEYHRSNSKLDMRCKWRQFHLWNEITSQSIRKFSEPNTNYIWKRNRSKFYRSAEETSRCTRKLNGCEMKWCSRSSRNPFQHIHIYVYILRFARTCIVFYIKSLLFSGQGEKTCVPEGSGWVPEAGPEGNTHLKITMNW